MVLVYPVITLEDPLAHRGSRTNLLGATPDTSLVRFFSNETRVTPLTPPTFLVASTDDATVPVENTIQFYLALHAAKVPAELHVYESGRHGFGLAPNDPYLGSWLERCAAWMARYRLVTSDSAR
jgi:acetyl esterase/lipase